MLSGEIVKGRNSTVVVDVGGDTEQQQQHQLVMVSGEDGQEQQLLIVSGDSADQQILTVSGEPISEQQLVSIIGETAAEQQLRLGKRKRKAPTAADELSPPAAGAGWARHALSYVLYLLVSVLETDFLWNK